MFRRKDELDIDTTDSNAQGSLLASNADTVNVLSPQQAAQYGAGSPSAANAPAAANSSSPATAPNVAPTQFGQVARPIQAEPRNPAPAAPSSFRPATSSQPVNDIPRRPVSESRSTAFSSPASSSFAAPSKDGRRVLTVGGEILLKGEITTCDRLVIEGKVDATVKEVHTMELAESGSFKGCAEVEYAEISGKFEGELTVRSALVIYSTGSVSGKITYGEIEIQRGGELTGEIETVGMKGSVSNQSKKKEAA